ncbi:MAG: signal recognition particle protein [Verrucomicrobiota bacterium]|jgi:signal recognition particle subunit SRP54|nr:signal recognition particle protein [Verrucomicrobiota bacterium]HCF96407.1 signal recognition particle protein [Verrucomicrobiota bacterium]
MFDALGEKLQKTFRNLRGRGKLSESNISQAMREIRLALLEADVNFRVARDFVATTQAKCIGQEVLNSITPGQQVVKIVHDELIALMSGEGKDQALNLPGGMATVLMVGLHGSGKTTTTGKLAKRLIAEGRKPMLVACDVYRPAAIDQLETLGQEVGAPVYSDRATQDVVAIAAAARKVALQQECNVLLVDTAGRLHIDDELIDELVRLRDKLKPHEILLVADAATGQEAVSIAERFDKALGVTGVVLTRLDGDARGGAALSMRAVTGKPIKLVGVGEKLDALDVFHPDRLVSRLLGMGDVVSLVEKAQAVVDEKQAMDLEQKLLTQQLDLEDFLNQLRQLRRMGSLEQIMGMLPGMGNVKGMAVDESELTRIEAIILSMTPQERKQPNILNPSRRRRVAAGSGTNVVQVNQLINRFNQMKKMMKKMGKLQKQMARMGGRMPGGMPKGMRFR